MLTVTPISSDAVILLPCSLALCSALWQVIKSRSQWDTRKGKLKTFKCGIGAFFAAAGASLLFFVYEVSMRFVTQGALPEFREVDVPHQSLTYRTAAISAIFACFFFFFCCSLASIKVMNL